MAYQTFRVMVHRATLLNYKIPNINIPCAAVRNVIKEATLEHVTHLTSMDFILYLPQAVLSDCLVPHIHLHVLVKE